MRAWRRNIKPFIERSLLRKNPSRIKEKSGTLFD